MHQPGSIPELPQLGSGVQLLETPDRAIGPLQTLVLDHLLMDGGTAVWIDALGYGTSTNLAKVAPSPRILDRIKIARGQTAYRHFSLVQDAVEQLTEDTNLIVTPTIDALYRSDDVRGLERFATVQNHYNVLYREEEREMLPLCEREGVGVIPWSPLARGVAARPHEQFDATTRGETDSYLQEMPYLQGGGDEINERIQELADEKGVSMAQIGLAWLLHQDAVDAPIVGTTSIDHLEDAVVATELDLAESDVAYLEEPYEPLPVAGHE